MGGWEDGRMGRWEDGKIEFERDVRLRDGILITLKIVR
jgi:hypothetical protein